MLFTVCNNPQTHTKCGGQKIGALFLYCVCLCSSPRKWSRKLVSDCNTSAHESTWADLQDHGTLHRWPAHQQCLSVPLILQWHTHMFISQAARICLQPTLCCVFVENPISPCGARVIFVLQHCEHDRIEFLNWLVLKFKNRAKNNGFDDFVH